MSEQSPLEKFVDAMIAAPMDANGNFARVEDATYAVHELVSLFGAFLETPSVLGIPMGMVTDQGNLLVIQMILAALHSQSCTPDRQAEAQAYVDKMLGGGVSDALTKEPEPDQTALSTTLEQFLKDIQAKGE